MSWPSGASISPQQFTPPRNKIVWDAQPCCNLSTVTVDFRDPSRLLSCPQSLLPFCAAPPPVSFDSAEEALSSGKRQLLEAEHRERTRIARDLFDGICQRLALLTVQLQQIEAGPSTSMLECRGVEELRKETYSINMDGQALAHELHFAKLEYLGLATSMKAFCREFSAQQKVNIDFSNNDLPKLLLPHISTCLFRVLQEALRNSAKHSGAHHFAVELRGSSDAIRLTVRDSGLGFDPETKRTHNGLGLISMEERLKLVNGMLSIDSQRNCGTTIRAHVPLNSTGALPFASA